MIAEVGIIKIAMDQVRKIVLFSIVFSFKIQGLNFKLAIGRLTLSSLLHKNN
jgi:hypothetical protein